MHFRHKPFAHKCDSRSRMDANHRGVKITDQLVRFLRSLEDLGYMFVSASSQQLDEPRLRAHDGALFSRLRWTYDSKGSSEHDSTVREKAPIVHFDGIRVCEIIDHLVRIAGIYIAIYEKQRNSPRILSASILVRGGNF